METMKLAGLVALGAVLSLPMQAPPARAQDAEDECHKATAGALYAQRHAAFDQCMAAKTKGKDKKG
jgi:hypothetical protein